MGTYGELHANILLLYDTVLVVIRPYYKVSFDCPVVRKSQTVCEERIVRKVYVVSLSKRTVKMKMDRVHIYPLWKRKLYDILCIVFMK